MATQTNPGPAYAYLLRIYRAGDQTNTAAPEAGDSINLAARSSGARDGPNEKGARWKSARAQLRLLPTQHCRLRKKVSGNPIAIRHQPPRADDHIPPRSAAVSKDINRVGA
jgi:hypothetical protein